MEFLYRFIDGKDDPRSVDIVTEFLMNFLFCGLKNFIKLSISFILFLWLANS